MATRRVRVVRALMMYEIEQWLRDLPSWRHLLQSPSGVQQAGSGQGGGGGMPTSSTESEAIDLARTNRQVHLMDHALAQLPPDLLELVRLRYMRELAPGQPEPTHEQVAAELEIPLRTYWGRRQRALITLICEIYFRESLENTADVRY